MLRTLPVIILCVLTLLVSCKRSKPNADDFVNEDSVAVPIEEVANAPSDQVEALTEVETPDSTDMDRNYRYDGSYIYVSKSKMRLYVMSANDSVLYSCGIACGMRKGDKQAKEDYRTPEGHFRISGIFDSTDWIHKCKDGREVKGCYGPCFLRLATGRFSGIGIHGTNAPGSIGRRASEGCIRVNSKHIIVLRDHYAYEGMPVIVAGELERLPSFVGLGEEITTPAAFADSVKQKTTDEANSHASAADSAKKHSSVHEQQGEEKSTTVREEKKDTMGYFD